MSSVEMTSRAASKADSAADELPILRIVDVWKDRGRNTVLKGVHLTAQRGQIMCLLGPSGAGKSTLLRTINAIERADRGLIFIDGEPIGCRPMPDGGYVRISEGALSRQRAQIGMVFQNFNLFPHMTVMRNIMDAPVRVLGMTPPTATRLAHDLLVRVGLENKAEAFPRQLSGGQQQRVAIARALAMSPKLMLFDEPTSALDPHLTGEVLDVIKTLAGTGISMLIVTHEISFAREVANTVVVMVDGQVVEQGPPSQVLCDPQDPRTRTFLAGSIKDPAGDAERKLLNPD
ncbi:amino acid ABC transporter ATP-binding protein [Microvirga zambiensis]|uniref:amino acid ABC transporter ATP-binding protein n=1 Tax=Microvirga zambiensis TaxID=1402137 RepID=UPI00191F77AA|nr:amino acid ABC transporter ATP-binding protein [Microvirga zambiensis]